MTSDSRKFLRFMSVPLAALLLPACSTLFDSHDLEVRAVQTAPAASGVPINPLYESAKTAINSRDYARALEYLQEARARNPRDVEVLNALGVVYDKLGRFDLSTRYYAQAQAVAPDSRVVARNIAYSNVLQGLQNPDRKLASAQVPETRPVDPIAKQPMEMPAAPPDAVARPAQSVPAVMLADLSSATLPQAARAMPQPETPTEAKRPAQLLVAWPHAAVTMPSRVGFPVSKQEPAVSNMSELPLTAAVPRESTLPLPVKRKVLTIGRPLDIIDASGRPDSASAIGWRLSALGWTINQAGAVRAQQVTALSYPRQNKLAAIAMQNTLPFPVRLSPVLNSAGMRLVIGSDYLRWKPKNHYLAARWRPQTVVASLSRTQSGGAR